MSRTKLSCTPLLLLSLLACGPLDDSFELTGASDDGALAPVDYNALNPAAGEMVLYELQVRTANACHPDLGSLAQRQRCTAKVAPDIPYRAEGMHCGQLDALKKIRLGTLDDLLEDTSGFDRGITVRHIDEALGASALWLMPLFPNNDRWSIPDACDDLGSPYAVRDYLHARGTLARRCILAGRDESSEVPCHGNVELDALIAQAHQRGLKVFLDVAFNHLGHNYQLYDSTAFLPVRERIAAGEDLRALWDYRATEESYLIRPQLLEDPDQLEALAASSPWHAERLGALLDRCPELSGQALVQAYGAWRIALEHERAQFPCDTSFLEYQAPGFYLGRDGHNPSRGVGDNFTNNWRDVKFLYLREEDPAHQHEFVRNREYLFRVLNYWASRGVDGFRLDHTSDERSGIDANFWKYVLGKVDYYAWRRGQARPVYLAEEFHDQQDMNRVVDILTEGYVGDMTGRGGVIKDASHVEQVVSNMQRFGGHSLVLSALETHDEKRLTDGTGFDVWTGAGFWGIGASTRSTPMLVMGQELGEPWQLGFRRSDLLRSRLVGTPQRHPQVRELLGYYRQLIEARLDHRNRALRAPNYRFLRRRHGNDADPRIYAAARWSDDGNVVFAVHNLWAQDVAQSYYLPPDLAAALSLRDNLRYRLVDAIGGAQQGACRSGAELKWDFYVSMDADTRAQWLRLERCD
ncbi:MAG: alpha-amylase family glycosyl hydrolase [Pseudomonadota bacterium]